MNKVTHFEIPAAQPEKSMLFYSNAFGWTFNQFNEFPYWFAKTGDENLPGINGAIMKRNHPQQPVTNNITVADIDGAIKKIESAGGTIVVPKTVMNGVGYSSYFKDPDGNIFGIMQPDSNA